MSLFKRLARMKAAELRVNLAQREVVKPASALLARGREHPLTTVGVAAGLGVALGSLDVHPMRVPGLSSLLSGGFAGIVAQGTRLLADFAEMTMATHSAADTSSPATRHD